MLLLAAGLLAAACDSTSSDADLNEVVVRTDASTEAVGAFEADDGRLVAYGFTGHHTDVRPGLRSYPLLARIDPVAGLVDTFVYREAGYGMVRSAVGHDGEIFTFIHEWQHDTDLPDTFHLDRIAPDGERAHLCTYDESSGDARLIPSRDGGFHFFIVRRGRLTKVDRSCAEVWSVDQAAAQVVELDDGDLAVAGPHFAEEIELARIRPTGERAWTTTLPFPEGMFVRKLAAASGDGMLLVALAEPWNGPTHLVRISGSGDVLWERTLEGGTYSPVHGHGLARIGDAGFVLATKTPANDGAYRSQIVSLGGDGNFRWHRPFGGWNRTAFVSDMLMLRSGRLAVVGFGFPVLTDRLISPRFDLIVEFIDGV